MHASFAALRARLSDVMAADAARLARRLAEARDRRAAAPAWSALAADIERSAARRAERAAA